jgi:predicted TPR repeat methyltransferase
MTTANWTVLMKPMFEALDLLNGAFANADEVANAGEIEAAIKIYNEVASLAAQGKAIAAEIQRIPVLSPQRWPS